jgi:hypothetical protein
VTNFSKNSHGTEKQKLLWTLLKKSEAMKKDKQKCSKGFFKAVKKILKNKQMR